VDVGENQTIRFSVIARVLQPAPLILDVLDSRIQTVDRNMRVVATGSRAANDSSDCLLTVHVTLDNDQSPRVDPSEPAEPVEDEARHGERDKLLLEHFVDNALPDNTRRCSTPAQSSKERSCGKC
jgi:hypothetical protein